MRLSILLQPKNEPDGESDGEYLAILECSRRVSNDTHWSPAVHVRRLYGDQFARTQAHIIYTVPTPLFGQQTETGRYETVFFKQKPVYPVPDFMISFDNLKDRDNSNAQTWVAEIYPPKVWDSETGILLSVSAGPQKPMFLVRFDSVHLDRNVFLDLVVGLERLPEGAWKPWSLQRLTAEHLSAQESLHQSYGKRPYSLVPGRPGRGGSWQPELNLHVKVKIHEQKLHERVHFLIKAHTYMELPEDTIDPSLPFFIHRTPASFGDAKPSTLEAQLQYFLGDFVFNGQLDRGFPSRELPAGHMIRTRSVKSTTDLFERSLEELPIRGVNPNETTFLNYCARGNFQGVSMMLQDDPRLTDSVSSDQHKLQPIHWAAVGGHRLVAKQLLSAGASLEARTAADGWTAMHLAALFGHFRFLRLLVFHELRGNIRSLEESDLLTDRENPFHDSPLHLAMSQVWAAESEAELDALEELTDGAQFSGLMRLWNDFEETPIHRLAACGMDMLARKRGMGELLTHENDAALANGYADKMGNVLPGYYIDHMGRTILWHAALSGQVEEVRQILEVSRLDVNVSDARGMSPLHVACRFGYTEVVQALLEAGAWANCVTNSPGFTPAHYAVLFNHVECLELLIEHGAYIQQGTNSNGFRCKPIHLANANGFQGIRQVLVAAGSSEHDFSCSHLVLNRSQNMETPGAGSQDPSASHDDYPLFGVIPTSSPAGRSLVDRFLSGEHTLSKSDFRAITLGVLSEEVHAAMVADFPPLAQCHELEGNSLSAISQVEDDARDNTIGPNEGLMPYYNLAYDLLDWKRRTKDDRNPEQFMFFRDEDGTPEDDVANLGKDTMQNDEGSATNAASASEMVERNQAAVVYNGEHWMPDGGAVAEDLLGRGTQEGQAVLEGEYEGDAKEESRAEGFLGTRQPTRLSSNPDDDDEDEDCT
ncbi:hypothetical protein PG985_001656 [Apiospora marii]|uniref:uncharacterized protein n=1 Tax=Apiospora marii TaxID=335849 RepID=UPI0031318BD6